jgi:hypothetical protein
MQKRQQGTGVVQRWQGDALQLAVSLAVSGAMFRWALQALDPNKDAKRAGKRRAATLSKRLGRRIDLHDLEHVRDAVTIAHCRLM